MWTAELFAHAEVPFFPEDVEKRRQLIDNEFADWFLRGAPGGEEDVSYLRTLLTLEAQQTVAQDDHRFDTWVNWIHNYTEAQATFTYVTPKAVCLIQNELIAAEYCWRMLSNDSCLDEWRPMPEAIDEQADLLSWWARFDGTPAGEYIDFILNNQDAGTSHHE